MKKWKCKVWKCKVMICIVAGCFTDSDLPSKNSTSQNLGTIRRAVAVKEKNLITHGLTGKGRLGTSTYYRGRVVCRLSESGRLGRNPGKIRGPGPQNVPAALLLYSETLNTALWSMAQSLWLQNRTRSTYNEHSLQTSFLILASDLAIPLSIGLLVE